MQIENDKSEEAFIVQYTCTQYNSRIIRISFICCDNDSIETLQFLNYYYSIETTVLIYTM